MDLRIFIFVAFVATAYAANSTYITCAESSFCSKLRYKETFSNYIVDSESVNINSNYVSVNLISSQPYHRLLLNITGIKHSIFRIVITDPYWERHNLTDVLVEEPALEELHAISLADSIQVAFDNNNARINLNPFKIDFYHDGEYALTLNNSRFTFGDSTSGDNNVLGFSVFFHNATDAYGLAEHADHLRLRGTNDNRTDPYRLYNLHVPNYEVNSTAALSGSVPFLYGHSTNKTAGVFFHNAAEQWVDIEYSRVGVNAYFMADTGAFDLFAILGPSPNQVLTDYVSLTGKAPTPPLWSLGYQQSGKGYISQNIIQEVITNFDLYEFPLDVVWMDIFATDGGKYFTWNPETFNDIIELQLFANLTNRLLLVLIEPHFKVEDDYEVYGQALLNNHLVLNADLDDYQAQSLPGLSSFLDFVDPDGRGYYSNLIKYENFVNTTQVIGGIWHGVNEPFIFDAEENTFPKDNVHHYNIRHADVHNAYGHYHAMASYTGLDWRGELRRPFVISTSHFAGTQRYAAVTIGPNTGSWEYINSSYAMCLTESLVGISFCGANVAGFHGEPNEELIIRFYQSGAWLPLFHAVSDNETLRQEPYLFNETVQNIIRDTMQNRYSHLPVWYTLFYEHYRFGAPVLRPLFFQYPYDANVSAIEDQILVGEDILVRPVTLPRASSVRLYLPGGENQIWYDIATPLLYRGNGYINVPVTLDRIPVFYRAGSVIPRKNVTARSVVDTYDAVYTFYIFADQYGDASGTLYIDDYESFLYNWGQYSYYLLAFHDDSLTIWSLEGEEINITVESYIIYRPPQNATGEFAKPERTVYTRSAEGRKISDIKSSGEKTVIKLK